MVGLYQIWYILFVVASGFVIAHALLSFAIAFNWVNTHNDAIRQIMDGLSRLLNPVYRPIRKILPDMGAIDLSPLAVLVGLQIADVIVRNILLGF